MTTPTIARGLHRPRGVRAVTVGFGIAYLVVLAAFALASSPRPPALGWLGFAIVVGVVLAVTWSLGDFLARSDRDPR
jgi:predicted exporter